MKVKFDKLNRYETPGFVVCNPGSIYKDGTLTRVVGVLPYTSDEEIEFNFNTTSTLSFRTYKIAQDGSPEKRYSANIYRSLQNRRLIFVDDIGYFIITDVQEGYSDGLTYKDITASSCEIEIQNKSLTFIADDTYRFIDLFERIVSTLPKWTIGYVDPDLAGRYRTFVDIDSTLNTLAFMMENMQDAYECIFVFDTIFRTISVYGRENYVNRTDIFLSKKDLINTLEIVENSDEHYTALSVFGEDELTISSINPLGTTTIYNFNCYLDWMSDKLRERVISWDKLVNSYLDPYYAFSVDYYNKYSECSKCQNDIDRIGIQIDMYTRCRDNIIAESSTDKVNEFNDAITNNGGEAIDISNSIEEMIVEIDKLSDEAKKKLSDQKTLLSNLQSDLDAARAKMTAIHEEVKITNYFSPEEYDELYDYIYEGIYNDEYVTTTDIMTTEEKMSQMRELYNRARHVLDTTAFPDQEFSIDVEDFIFIKEFQRWSEQLETGCLINVELDDGDVAELFLTVIRLNWEDKSLSLTFGSRFNKLDPQSLFNNVLGNIQKSSNTINYIKDIIYPVKSGKLDELEDSLNNSKFLAINDVLMSSNGEVLIDGTGYTGKKRTDSDDSFLPEQLKVTSNSIVLTDDGWRTRRPAIGYIKTTNGQEKYGIIGEAIIGNIAVGECLSISFKNDNNVVETLVNTNEDLSSKITELNSFVNNNSEDIEMLERKIGDIGDQTVLSLLTSIRSDFTNEVFKINKSIGLNASAIEALKAQIEDLQK